MKLQELLKNIEPIQIIGDADVEVSGINIDSRKIKEGHLFVAMKGTQVDGHKFIPKALELGAKSVLCEDLPEEKVEGVTYIHVFVRKSLVDRLSCLLSALEFQMFSGSCTVCNGTLTIESEATFS